MKRRLGWLAGWSSFLLVGLLAATPARAESISVRMSGVCDGRDDPWAHQPQQVIKFADHFTQPVNIVGIEVRLWPEDHQQFDRNSYVLAGNGDTPDVMAYGDEEPNGTWRIEQWFPPGYWFPFTKGWIDLHVSCYPAGIKWTANYVVHYLPAPQVTAAQR